MNRFLFFALVMANLLFSVSTKAKEAEKNNNFTMPYCADKVIVDKLKTILTAQYEKFPNTKPIIKRRRAIILKNIENTKPADEREFIEQASEKLVFIKSKYLADASTKIAGHRLCKLSWSRDKALFFVIFADAANKDNLGFIVSDYAFDTMNSILEENIDFMKIK